MKTLHTITMILLIVGGLNWGLTAFGYNVIEMLLGGFPAVVTTIYVLVGLSAIYEIFTHKSNCKMCDANTMA
ncbi:MAG: DUF378 domain-containing protein [Patescibacteria group bacterium]